MKHHTSDFQALHDFRRLSDQVARRASPELVFEIRRARDRRELAIQLCEATEGAIPSFSLSATPRDDPEQLGGAIRRVLGITYQDQIQYRPDYPALNWWRGVLEQAGVLVFQARDVPVKEARAFSITDAPFPVVVTNIKDAPRARLFSMLHEICHIALQKGGVCDLYEEGDGPSTDDRQIEVLCNRAAGAALVPRECLLSEPVVQQKGRATIWDDEEVRFLADRYGVSREVLLRRLLICGRTTEEFYRARRRELLREYEALEQQRQPGFAPPHRVAVSVAGTFFVRLVLSSYYQDKITASDVADFLEIRLKHLKTIEAEVLGSSGGTGAGA